MYGSPTDFLRTRRRRRRHVPRRCVRTDDLAPYQMAGLSWFDDCAACYPTTAVGLGDMQGGFYDFIKKVGNVIAAPFKAVKKLVVGDKKAEQKKAAAATKTQAAQAAQSTAQLQQKLTAVTTAIPLTTTPAVLPATYYTGGSWGGGGGGGGAAAQYTESDQPSALDRFVPGLPQDVGGIKTEYLVYGALGLLGVGVIAALVMGARKPSVAVVEKKA